MTLASPSIFERSVVSHLPSKTNRFGSRLRRCHSFTFDSFDFDALEKSLQLFFRPVGRVAFRPCQSRCNVSTFLYENGLPVPIVDVLRVASFFYYPARIAFAPLGHSDSLKTPRTFQKLHSSPDKMLYRTQANTLESPGTRILEVSVLESRANNIQQQTTAQSRYRSEFLLFSAWFQRGKFADAQFRGSKR